jgi:hypothetical protein
MKIWFAYCDRIMYVKYLIYNTVIYINTTIYIDIVYTAYTSIKP